MLAGPLTQDEADKYRSIKEASSLKLILRSLEEHF